MFVCFFCGFLFFLFFLYATSIYSPTLCGIPRCNLTKYLSDFYLFIFPSYITVSVKVILSTLMQMRKLI